MTEYTDTTHKTGQPWTLLYVDGKLQTNAAQTYLILVAFLIKLVLHLISQHIFGTSSYDLIGTSTGGNNNGYKWC